MHPIIDRIFPTPAGDLSDNDLAELFALEPGRHVRANFLGLGEAETRIAEQLRRVADAVVIDADYHPEDGFGRLRVSDESAAWRLGRGMDPHPVFVILTRELDVDVFLAGVTDAPFRLILVTTADITDEQRARVGDRAEVIIAGGDKIDLVSTLGELAARGLDHTLWEAREQLYGELSASGIIDELCFALRPAVDAKEPNRIGGGPQEEPEGFTLGTAMRHEGTLLLRFVRP